jgi:hypothetical protein
MDFYQAIQQYAEQPITKQLLLDILKEYKRPHDKIDELVKQELLTQVKRGFYIPGPKLHLASPEPFLIANHLYGPSYVSLDSALSYLSIIPERVYETSSVTPNLPKAYRTPIGKFSYTRLPYPYYSYGIQQIQLTEKQVVLMASPEKALCDKVITTSNLLLRSVKQTRALLTEDLRIDENALKRMDASIIATWIKKAPKANSLLILLKTLQSL